MLDGGTLCASTYQAQACINDSTALLFQLYCGAGGGVGGVAVARAGEAVQGGGGRAGPAVLRTGGRAAGGLQCAAGPGHHAARQPNRTPDRGKHRSVVYTKPCYRHTVFKEFSIMDRMNGMKFIKIHPLSLT